MSGRSPVTVGLVEDNTFETRVETGPEAARFNAAFFRYLEEFASGCGGELATRH